MGLTPGTGYTNRAKFPTCNAAFSGHPADFVKYCYDNYNDEYEKAAARVYGDQYFATCKSLEQPAFYVCADISVMSGPGRARSFM